MSGINPAYTPMFRRHRHRSVITASIAAIAFLSLVLLGVTKRHTIHSVHAKFFSKSCSPYDQHGYVAYDPTATHRNRWTPYANGSAECHQPAPALAASFLRSSWAATKPSLLPNVGMDWTDTPIGPDGRPWEDVEWARNKTVFVLGDSISRFTTRYFCDMAGESLIELNWNHPWSPPEIPKDYRADGLDASLMTPLDPALDPFGWHKINKGKDLSHTGHYCYVPGLDFLIVHVHTYGLDTEDYWAFKPTYIPPYTFEERTAYLARGYLDRIRASTGRGSPAPELVYVNSGMWDVVRYSHQDTQAGLEVDTPLSPERLTNYRQRVRDVVVDAARAFPQSTIRWATTHYPIIPSKGWFYNDAKVKPKTRPDIKMIRLIALHEAAMSALRDTEDASSSDRRALGAIKLNRWGLAMRGWEKQQVDDLHPTFLPGGYLWADMVLYELREAVL